jgi:hypothetical protein
MVESALKRMEAERNMTMKVLIGIVAVAAVGLAVIAGYHAVRMAPLTSVHESAKTIVSSLADGETEKALALVKKGDATLDRMMRPGSYEYYTARTLACRLAAYTELEKAEQQLEKGECYYKVAKTLANVEEYAGKAGMNRPLRWFFIRKEAATRDIVDSITYARETWEGGRNYHDARAQLAHAKQIAEGLDLELPPGFFELQAELDKLKDSPATEPASQLNALRFLFV